MTARISLHPDLEGLTTRVGSVENHSYLELRVGGVELNIFAGRDAISAFEMVADILRDAFAKELETKISDLTAEALEAAL